MARVQSIDPTTIGVIPAAEGSPASAYLGRHPADAELDSALTAGLAGGRTLIFVDGPPVSGKSRTLFESLRRHDEQFEPLEVLAPRDYGALRAVLDPTYGVAPNGPAVLWLDDFLSFLRSGLEPSDLMQWRAGGPRRIIAATRNSSRDSAITQQFAPMAESVYLPQTTDDDLLPLRPLLSEPDYEVARQHGWAAYLIGGHFLEDKLNSRRHQGDVDQSVEGAAVAIAAIDWQRAGRGDAISPDSLRDLASKHLADTASTTDPLTAGLTWALRPVSGTTALLVEVEGGYRATDYAFWIRSHRQNAPVSEAVWAAAAQTKVPFWAFMVGLRAHADGWWDTAIAALSNATNPRSTELPISLQMVAWAYLSEALENSERYQDALVASQSVVRKVEELTSTDESTYGAMRATALVSIGNLHSKIDPPAGNRRALEYWQTVIDDYFPVREPSTLLPVVNALANKAYILSESADYSDWRDAAHSYELLISDYFDKAHPHSDSDIRFRVARSMISRGEVLQRWNQPGEDDDALITYQHALDAFKSDSDPKVRDLTDDAVIDGALILHRRNDRSEAARRVVSDALRLIDQRLASPPSVWSDATATESAIRVARTLMNKAVFETHLGYARSALLPLRRIASDYSRADAPQLRRLVAQALINVASISKHFEDTSSQATEAYRRVVRNYSGADDPVIAKFVKVAVDALEADSA